MKNRSLALLTKFGAVAGLVGSAAVASAAAPDLTAIGTEALLGIGSGVTAGMPIAAGIAGLTIAVLVFKKVRNAGN